MTKDYEVVNTRESENTSSKDFLLGAIVGGVVGAAAALFLAPKPGKELMNDVNEQAAKLKGKGIELSGTVKDKGSEFISIAKEQTDRLSSAVTKHSIELKDKVKVMNADKKESASIGDESSSSSETEGNGHVEDFKTGYDEIQQKLEETKKAFDETESKYNH
ncbi:YtxH domain-containing protein [Niallia sp. 03133]|uniref:YtxH domain-containing protein n=1 Tax=Niallia sp. 03133 TaxID=3458060 RepID=UPI004044064C